MGGAVELTGPDLAAGVALETLREGEPTVGHAHGEPIVVVRRGKVVRAVGATCTHYSGPLGDGLVVGETIRCPWHHACFDLTTGEPIGAPALAPIPCYDVRVDGNTLRVGGKRPHSDVTTPPGLPESIVIIGAGAAGTAAALELRRRSYHAPITLIGDEQPGPVDRPNLSKDYLAGNAPEEWIPLRTADDLKAIGCELVLESVRALDTKKKQVTLASGRTIGYDALLYATGAEPVRPPIEGATLPHVHTLRTLADSRAIIEKAATAKRAVVIGSSFIGLEAAASLRARNLEVDVIGLEAVPLERVLGSEIGRFVQALHESRGVRFHLQTSADQITASTVRLNNGTVLAADLVVLGVGVRPRVALAEAAGLKLENGVVVDELLQTSAPDVWAAGDVARYPDRRSGSIRVEHWAAAERQGQAAARSMMGFARPFTDVPFFWSAHYDVTIGYVGHSEKPDHIEVLGDLAAKSATVVYRKQGRVEAVATIGRDRQSLLIEAAMEADDDEAINRALKEQP